jgi:replication initiation and membrane attachment protein DnaB
MIAAYFTSWWRTEIQESGVVGYLTHYRIWRMLAFPVIWNLDRSIALNFLLARVMDNQPPLANYYQALGKLSALESAPVLEKAILNHRREVEQLFSPQSWEDRFAYLDYLSCSATLFTLTGEERYRSNIQRMLQTSDEIISGLARMVATSSEVPLDE